MRLIDVLGIIKPYMEVEIVKKVVVTNEDGESKTIDTQVYKGKLRDWDAKLNDVIHEYVEFVYTGYSDHVSITLKN